jgi:outer membrane biosynthesis protein TonB
MSLIQIPLEPPVERQPEQGDLFDSQNWESAYREMHDFPTLLIQARDELSKSRKREAFWISLIAHIVLILIIVNSPSFEKYFPHRAVMMVNGRDNNKLTFLELPPDAQKLSEHPKTNVMSDKNRIATTKTPQPDPKELKKLLDTSRRGRPGPVAPPEPKQQTQPQQQMAQAQPQPQQQPQEAQPQPPPPPQQMAKLQTPPVAHKPQPTFDSQPTSAGQAIDQAARRAALGHKSYGGDAGDLGLGQRQSTMRMGAAEITSDTMGVDFGPYMQRILHDVKQNWYNLIPESAMPPLLKKGKLSIEFAILKNGQIAGLRYVTGSGDVALDRAAYGGITSSTPFPPLPSEFGGQYLGLRFTFLYNPDPNSADLQ